MSTQTIQPTVGLPLVSAALGEHGFAVIDHVGDLDGAAETLAGLGTLMPQYDGNLTHEVTHRPGNEGRSYSQSTNRIQAHTEAPGWTPSPAWLALYCHRQARCGGGHTDLLDVEHLLPHLSGSERSLLARPVWFPAPASAGGGVRRAPLSDGVLRFSYNLLTAGSYDPELDTRTEPTELPLGRAGAKLADKVSRLFEHLRTRILIPEGGLLIWDNQRLLHARSNYADTSRHLTRFWIQRPDAP